MRKISNKSALPSELRAGAASYFDPDTGHVLPAYQWTGDKVDASRPIGTAVYIANRYLLVAPGQEDPDPTPAVDTDLQAALDGQAAARAALETELAAYLTSPSDGGLAAVNAARTTLAEWDELVGLRRES